MPWRPGFVPVMNPDHDTLEIVGMLDVMRARVPARRSAAMRGITPASVSASTSGAPTPSSPMTAARGFPFGFLNRSKSRIRSSRARPALRVVLLLERLAGDHELAALIGARRAAPQAAALRQDLDHGAAGGDRVAEEDGAEEPQRLLDRYAAGELQEARIRSREQTRGQHAVRHAAAEARPPRVLFVEMHRIVIAAETREQHDVGFLDRLRVDRLVPDLELLEALDVHPITGAAPARRASRDHRPSAPR